MKDVKVEKSALRAKIRGNLEGHRSAFEKAFEGYRKACIAALEQNLTAVKGGSKERIYIGEVPPTDHSKDYQRALAMLEMSVDDYVIITEKAFQQFVLDDWDWKEQWAASNTKYLNS